MPNRNMHEVMGHLGRDPEIQYTGTGTQFCKLSIATSNNYKDNHTGEWIERDPDWHRATVWGDLAEKVAVEFAKGDAIMIRGKSHTREYLGNNGEKRWSTEITVTEVFRPVYVSKNERSGHMDLRRQKSEDEKNIEEFEEFPFDEGDLEVDIPF